VVAVVVSAVAFGISGEWRARKAIRREEAALARVHPLQIRLDRFNAGFWRCVDSGRRFCEVAVEVAQMKAETARERGVVLDHGPRTLEECIEGQTLRCQSVCGEGFSAR